MSDARPRFLISVAAELAGMHPQTLREYDRLGIVSPARTPGRGRRYSLDDVERLREVQRLSQEEGVNLSGIKRIMRLERQLKVALAEVERLRLIAEPGHHRVFSADQRGDVVVTRSGHRVQLATDSTALVLWRPRHPTRP
ncbi:MAG: helix-turn-helix transcriptional regulator [bacterium]|nr:helix-turn-helix transcriptional regulator [bacterium]